MDEALVPEVKRIMQQYNVQTNQIWFELTEFADVQDKDALRKIIIKLTNQGFRFALDDFGKGQSNLIRLFDYPFHCIKFDKELVLKLTENQMTHSMIPLDQFISFAKHFLCKPYVPKKQRLESRA